MPRSRFKPRRGGLFIDYGEPNNLPFCFSAARQPANSLRNEKVQRMPRQHRKLKNRAAEKQKEGIIGHHLAINRPPLRGSGRNAPAKAKAGTPYAPQVVCL